jgi:hypothetical protein
MYKYVHTNSHLPDSHRVIFAIERKPQYLSGRGACLVSWPTTKGQVGWNRELAICRKRVNFTVYGPLGHVLTSALERETHVTVDACVQLRQGSVPVV